MSAIPKHKDSAGNKCPRDDYAEGKEHKQTGSQSEDKAQATWKKTNTFSQDPTGRHDTCGVGSTYATNGQLGKTRANAACMPNYRIPPDLYRPSLPAYIDISPTFNGTTGERDSKLGCTP